MLSMEDLLDRNLIEEKEPLIVGSRRIMRELCEEFGITNQRMLGNQFSAIVVHLERYQQFNGTTNSQITEVRMNAAESVRRIIEECQASTGVTKL